MIRICTSLLKAGHEVLLIGRSLPRSLPLQPRGFSQHRLNLFTHKGKLFYIEYQIRLFFYLLKKKADAVIAIDLDTIIPCYYASVLKGWKRAMDAHEYFTGQKEVISRPGVYRIWKSIERYYLPKFKHGYTVSAGIANLFKNEYNLSYQVIRNTPTYHAYLPHRIKTPPVLIYRGAVNEARGLLELIDAIQNLDVKLIIYGNGNFEDHLREKLNFNNTANKVVIKGAVLPQELEEATQEADIGINLIENNGLNQYHSLANKFFDLMQHGIPQVTMNYPEYRAINQDYEVAILINDLNPDTISDALRELISSEVLYNRLSNTAIEAAKIFCWENEEANLLSFYKRFLG